MGGNDTQQLCECHGEPMWKHGKKHDGSQKWLCKRSRGGTVVAHVCGTGRWVAGEDRPRCKTHDVPMYTTGEGKFACRVGHKKTNDILRAAKIAAKPLIPCRQCGEQFRVKNYGFRYCSSECRQKAKRERDRIRDQAPMRRLNKQLRELTRTRIYY